MALHPLRKGIRGCRAQARHVGARQAEPDGHRSRRNCFRGRRRVRRPHPLLRARRRRPGGPGDRQRQCRPPDLPRPPRPARQNGPRVRRNPGNGDGPRRARASAGNRRQRPRRDRRSCRYGDRGRNSLVTTEYPLVLESGPKMKTTMVHVLDLLGCIANGPTTEAALEAAPVEIKEYLRFLGRHGEDVDADAPFTTSIAAHVMEGSFIGQGDPAPGFAPDFEPLIPEDESTYRRRFQWLGEELVALIGENPSDELPAKPSKGRLLRD